MKLAIIGGSGLEKLGIIGNQAEVNIGTPYGATSSPLTTGKIGNADVVFLSRHGYDHSIPPTQVNNRANIYALKEIGCTHIIVTTACGSLREEIGRGDLVLLDQFIDFTRSRKLSFYDEFKDGVAMHTAMSEPFSEELRKTILASAKKLNLKIHDKGTVITIEGPRFSTRAESNMFRIWGADVINMSIAPECILANEMKIPYAAIALSTDYDCWKTDEEPVTWDAILEIFNNNIHNVTNLLLDVFKEFTN